MKSFRTILVALCAIGLLMPAVSSAQVCPNPIPINCGDTVGGDTTGEPTNISGEYSCIGWSISGPEAYYTITPATDVTMTASALTSGWDGAIAILPESGGDCDPANCLDGQDSGDNPEEATYDLVSGQTYYIVVDGYGVGDAGTFDLTITCEVCVDGDGDTYYGYDAVDCPSGTDCDDTDGNINPGADDNCGDVVDSDCDGFDCADFCLPAAAIACGDIAVAGDTTGAGSTPNFYDTYGVACDTGYSYTGREYVYTFTLAEDTSPVTIVVEPEASFDTVIFLLREAGSGCLNTDCVDAEDWALSGGAETMIAADLTAGTYYIVVDGWGGEGAYTISVSCVEICEDIDGDGYNGYDASMCLSGEDCCDVGDEGGPGCDVANAPNINPGALEICEDGIDNNCSGQDDACPNCGADATLACDDSGTIDTETQGANNLVDYCGAGYDAWTGNEYIFEYTAAADGAILFSTVNDIDIDISVLLSYGGGVCDPDSCYATSWWVGDVDETAGVFAETGETYYFAVDLWDGEPNGTYDWTFSCLDEICSADGSVVCGSSLTADNLTAVNSMSLYDGYWSAMLANDVVYSFNHDVDTSVTVDLLSPDNLGLLILEDDGGCSPANLIGVSDDWALADEQVSFMAAAGVTYYVVVDGRLPSIEGSYDLAVECTLDCGALTQCDYHCVDTTSDVDHCGDCNQVCFYDHATPVCNASNCEMGVCDAGWDNCDLDPANGCEVDLMNDPDHCGTCVIACSGATPYCIAGACTDQCPAGLTDCGGFCVDTDTDVNHCGQCDLACALDNVDVHACVAAVCGIVTCTEGYADCDLVAATGCEIPLGTADNCSGCGDACAYDNAAGLCEAGACAMGDCDAGYADCDLDAVNGCEIPLGTADNCSGCGDACAFDNATAACNVDTCEMGECDANYGDCNSDDSDGCESELDIGDQCDNDGDGFADHEYGGPDCDDTNENIYPGADETCNQVDDNCDGTADEGFDGDGDGYTSCGGDCNDDDPSINPDAFEACDSLDNNCDGEIDEGGVCDQCVDADHDGFDDDSCGGDDCNDNDKYINPDAFEACDSVDNNCDGETDEDGACDKGIEGCGCSTDSNGPLSGGALVLVLALGLAVLRRREG